MSNKPLEAETWASRVDAVGGAMLARVIGQLKYGASVAAVGHAGGATLQSSVIPFLLRGVNLLGIDSVNLFNNARKRGNVLPTIYPSWIQSGSAQVGLKGRLGADLISTGSAVQNRTNAQCLINT